MSFNVNPNTIYYLLIYAIIVVLRFFKMYRQVKSGTEGRNWRHYCFVALEFVYSSAGIVILLLTAAPQWASVIIMAYIVLLLVSAFLDAMGDDFPEGTRLLANVSIILIVSVLSVTFNQTVLFSKAPQTSRASDKSPATLREYVVAVPYIDYTLRRHLGERLGERMLVFVTAVKASTRDEAVAAAKRQFWDENNSAVTPFDPKRPKTPQTVFLDADRIIVEART
jgi:hypothetical protein